MVRVAASSPGMLPGIAWMDGRTGWDGRTHTHGSLVSNCSPVVGHSHAQLHKLSLSLGVSCHGSVLSMAPEDAATLKVGFYRAARLHKTRTKTKLAGGQ